MRNWNALVKVALGIILATLIYKLSGKCSKSVVFINSSSLHNPRDTGQHWQASTVEFESKQRRAPEGNGTQQEKHPVKLERPLPHGVCGMYKELRDINFLHTSIKGSICQGVPAYSIIDSEFPVCELQTQLPQLLTDSVVSASFKSYIQSPVTRRRVSCFVYSSADFISNAIRESHIYELENVNMMMRMVQKLNAQSPVTFVDIGSNIGVFALTALDLGVPVVALDANIRNLIRIKLSAESSGALQRLRLLWNFISSQVSLMYLNFPSDCNMGGATKFGRAVADTIPVMSTTGDSIASKVGTQTIAMKVDIEGGEAAFFSSAQRLFSQFTIPVVHMEWLKRHMSEDERKLMLRFFLTRHYSPRSMRQLSKRVNIEDAGFEGDELVWIREDFVKNFTSGF